MARKIPSQRQETNNILFVVLTNDYFLYRGENMSREREMRSSLYSCALMKTLRMCVHPLTANQSEDSLKGDVKSPKVHVCAPVCLWRKCHVHCCIDNSLVSCGYILLIWFQTTRVTYNLYNSRIAFFNKLLQWVKWFVFISEVFFIFLYRKCKFKCTLPF